MSKRVSTSKMNDKDVVSKDDIDNEPNSKRVKNEELIQPPI